MNYLLNLASTVSPVPDQEDGLRPGLDPSQVTPGLLGFVFTLLMVIAVIFLIRDMSKRIRRVRYQGMMDEATGSGSPETGPNDDRVPGERRANDSDSRPETTPGNR
ncbi:hypothetical protein [Arthrobacter sp. Bz4]|uniref:hypothetical protein n=1 Tax=Arthrobacter sp. Bz4 TaxID=2171979 RepID=UPI001A9C34A8|nr:hypothetical protein [Arthrobacter sp. Bz4]